MLFMFLSCKKDDDDPFNNNNNSIVTTPSNNVPVAQDDTKNTDRATPFTFSVLDNDSDADQDNLTITSYTQTNYGSLAKNNDNTFSYVPNGDTVVTDTFNYTISDGTAQATAKVSISVNKTISEKNTETTLNQYDYLRLSTVDNTTEYWNHNYLITFNTTNKTVTVNFTQNDSLSFTNSSNITESYKIGADGGIILPNVTYYMQGSIVISGYASGFTFYTNTAGAVNTELDVLQKY